MILSYLAYKDQRFSDLVFFPIVAYNHELFAPVQIEAFDYEYLQLGYNYSSAQIREILSAHFIAMHTYSNIVAKAWQAEPFYAYFYDKNLGATLAQAQYRKELNDELDRIDSLLQASVASNGLERVTEKLIDTLDLFREKRGIYDYVCDMLYGRAYQFEIFSVPSSRMRAMLKQRFQIWLSNQRLVNFLTKVQSVFDSLLVCSQPNLEFKVIAAHTHLPAFSDRSELYRLHYDLRLINSELSDEERLCVNNAGELFTRGCLSDVNNNNNNVEVETSSDEYDVLSDLSEAADDTDLRYVFPIGVGQARGQNEQPCQLSRIYREYLENSWRQYQRAHKCKPCLKVDSSKDSNSQLSLKRSVELEAEYATQSVRQLESMIGKLFGAQGSLVSSCLINSGLWPRSNPVCIVKYMLAGGEHEMSLDETGVNLCGAICVAWCLRSQTMRKVKWARRKDAFNMERENANRPHVNWSPKNNPQWLVIQLEMDIIIRATQVQVAKCMINPPRKVSLLLF